MTNEQREYWDVVAGSDVLHDEVCDADIPTCLDATIPYIDIPHLNHLNPMVFLDLGCGYGRLSFPVANRMGYVIGVDISPLMLQRANSIKTPEDNVVFRLTDGKVLPPMMPVDAAFSVAMFQHVDDETMAGYIRQVAKCLRPMSRFRFQFVDGPTAQHGPLTYDRPTGDVIDWCEKVGLHVSNMQFDLIHDRWTWVTVEKPA